MNDSILVVPVMLNHEGPFDLILDTGTDTSVIDSDLARSLKLGSLDLVTLNSNAAAKAVPRSVIGVASLGAVAVSDLEVLQISRGSLGAPGTRVRGILGQNFLGRFNLLLDYKRRAVCLMPLSTSPALTGGTPLPVHFEHGRPALVGKTPDGHEVRLLLDTGSTDLTIFNSGLTGFRECASLDCNQTLGSALGGSQVSRGTLLGLAVGPLRLWNIPALLSRNRMQEDHVDGLLPASLFASVFINNAQGFAVLRSR